jgi:uncharacterized protein
MLIISSSAKTLDFKTPYTTQIKSQVPIFNKQATIFNNYLRTKQVGDLTKILEINEKLAILNFQRNQDWKASPTEEGTRPAIYAYKGDVFRQLHPHDYSPDECAYAHNSLMIMSGLYGVVRAFDAIQPYRFGMATKVKDEIKGEIPGKLNEFWKTKITDFLNAQIKEQKHRGLINLASKEYAKPVDKDKLECPFITVDFKEDRGGVLKTMGLYAKRARGMMIDYCIKNKIENPEDLKEFAKDGYHFATEEDGHYIFIRAS